MKKFIPTLLLVALCIGSFWYASSQDFFREKVEGPKVLVTVNPADVRAISVQTLDNQVELKVSDQVWTMTKPSAMPINTYMVGNWVDALSLLTAEKVIEENVANLANYGLDQPMQVFKVTLQDGSTKAIEVGAALPIEGYYYAKVEGSATVYQVGEQALASLNKAPLEFMDSTPVKLDQDQVKSMKLTWKGQSWSLVKSNADKPAIEAGWKLGEKELQGSEASQLIGKLVFLSTSDPVKKAAEINLDASELAVEFVLAEDGTDSTRMYRGKLLEEQVWLSQQGEEWAYALPFADIQSLADQLTELSK
ncbi:hypothetical protein D3C73_684940 [compost metagenome]